MEVRNSINPKTLIQSTIFDSLKKLQDRNRSQEVRRTLLNSPIVDLDAYDDHFENNRGRTLKQPNLAKRKLPFDLDYDKVVVPVKKSSPNKNINWLVVNRPVASSTPNKLSNELSDGDTTETRLQNESSASANGCTSSNSETGSTIIETMEEIEKSISSAHTIFKRVSDLTITQEKSVEEVSKNTDNNRSSNKTDIKGKKTEKSHSTIMPVVKPLSANESQSSETVIKKKRISAKNDAALARKRNNNKEKVRSLSTSTHHGSVENIKIIDNIVLQNSKISKPSSSPSFKIKLHEKADAESSDDSSEFFVPKANRSDVQKIKDSVNQTNTKEKTSSPETPRKYITTASINRPAPKTPDKPIVAASTSKSSPKTPTKRGSPGKRSFKRTPKKGSPGLGSPKKESDGMNMAALSRIKELFDSLNGSVYLKSMIRDEKEILSSFFTANAKYQYTCLKLYTYKPKWYNRHKFCERIKVGMNDKEIADMYNFFAKKGIVETDYGSEDLSYLMSLLNLPDLKKIVERFKLKRSVISKGETKRAMGKAEVIQYLLSNSRTQSTLTFAKSSEDLLYDEVGKMLGMCFKLKKSFRDAFYKAYLLGTFVNRDFANLNDFLFFVNSNISFPDYSIEDYVVFYNKEEFHSYAEARKISEAFENAMTVKNYMEMLTISKEIFLKLQELADEKFDEMRYFDVPHLKCFRSKSVYVSTLNRAVKHLQAKYPEDTKEWLEFFIQKIESPHRIGEWYYHLMWLYMKHLVPKNYERASELLLEVLRDHRKNLSERQLYSLHERGEQLKMSKKYKINQLYYDTISELLPAEIDSDKFPMNVIDAKTIRSNDIGKKRSYVVQDKEGCKSYMNVENIALAHYIDSGEYTGGKHSEGSIVKALFTAFFWDLIYNPDKVVPAAFISKYQTVPLDMYTSYFYTNRKDAIDKRLKDLASGWSEETVLNFAKNQWRLHSQEKGYTEMGLIIESEEMLTLFIDCFGRKLLSGIFQRLVKDIGQYSSGMPDLLLWNEKQKTIKFVEVKGENDKLSITQKLWIRHLLSIGANAEVCHVHSTGSKRKYVSKKEEKSMNQSLPNSSLLEKE